MIDIKRCYYTTILSQTISTDGRFLFCGSNFGEIFVYSIERIVTSNENGTTELDKLPTTPVQVFSVSDRCSINSLSFHKDFLIVGLNGEIWGYQWSSKSASIGKKVWVVKLPAPPESADMSEVNYLWLNQAEEILYAGCGDNIMYGISLEDGKVCRDFRGHKDYIHCVTGCGSKLATASEDGSVMLWDCRQKKHTAKLEPHTKPLLQRPEFGRWQGTVSLTDDWFVCGGGPRFSLWHLRSLECTADFDFPERVHVSGFIDDLIYAGGDGSKFYQYNFNGDVTAEVPVSGPSAYSVALQTEPYKFLAIAGSSAQIDVCTNFTYRDIILNTYKK
ncbi:THO complex subunit 6 [Anopheles bellator]|uniref:THO complex subunit 6 n=1 Tax=Anopheles bellator TaxID=139047 RepID=UPI002648C139|nr:THO complex subunit 6 [Anopheles bellator]